VLFLNQNLHNIKCFYATIYLVEQNKLTFNHLRISNDDASKQKSLLFSRSESPIVTMNSHDMRVSLIQKLLTVPRQHAVDCDWCGQWQHRQCFTGMLIFTLNVGVELYLQVCTHLYLQDAIKSFKQSINI